MRTGDIVGQVIDGKYNIEKQLGKGGMGSVYLATHIGTERPVAVKVIAPEFMQRAEFVERFRREARAAGRLRHPNVVDVTDFGFSRLESGEDAAYLVMEYLDGCTLGEVLDEEKQLPVRFSIDILEQICSAVEEAHKQGIIHRDLKPDNIWLEPNQRGGYTVKVLDFGIAKLEEVGVQDIDGLENSPHAGGPATQVDGDKKTMAVENDAPTVSELRSPTVTPEGETIAIPAESGTIVSEAGTIIQEEARKSEKPAPDPEGGTAIMPSGDTLGDQPEEDNKGTKVISGIDTDRPSLDTPTTNDLTRVGAVLGTPLYMSPEQCRGEKLSARSDIYSLAVIVYQMLSGTLPFEGDYREVMDGHKNSEPPPLKAKKAPKRLRGMVMQSLAKDPDKRPESAEAFASKVRANSDGLGTLLRRSMIIYTERLPKFLTLTFLTLLPVVVLTFLRVGFGLLVAGNVLEKSVATDVGITLTAIVAFLSQVVAAAFLVGMTTWVVAQTLAFPLRPINLPSAFREVKKRWKPLAVTVTITTLITIACAFIGFVGAGLGWGIQGGLIYYALGQGATIVTMITTAVIGALVLFVVAAGFFMLVAPSIMMEGVSGRSAFRRSIELVQRSRRTVMATAVLVYIVPTLLAAIVALGITSVVRNVEMAREMKKMKIEGVEPQKPAEEKPERKGSPELNVSFNNRGVNVTTSENEKSKDDENESEEEEKKDNTFLGVLREAIIEIVWTPIAILITSFTTVVTALIYFKTRQAGGESMQELLGKLDDADRPQSKWQQRVRERLIESGKITGNPSQS